MDFIKKGTSEKFLSGETGEHLSIAIVSLLADLLLTNKQQDLIRNLQFANSHYTAQGPDVRLAAVTLLVEHFWGQAVGSSTDCLPPVSCWLQLGSQTKVPNLQLHRLAYKEVPCREGRG